MVYGSGIYCDAPETLAERRQREIETLQRRIALGLARPERTQQRQKALLRLTMNAVVRTAK